MFRLRKAAFFSLPAKFGGLGLTKPNEESSHTSNASKHITASLSKLIINQDIEGRLDKSTITETKAIVCKDKLDCLKHLSTDVHASLPLTSKDSWNYPERKDAPVG